MGRCNNRRTREAAAASQNTPSRARFSKGPPKRTTRKRTDNGNSHQEATKQAVVHKIVQRFEAPLTRTAVTAAGTNNNKSNARIVLDERTIKNLDEIKLSEESVRIIEKQLQELGVIEEDRTTGELAVIDSDGESDGENDEDLDQEEDHGPMHAAGKADFDSFESQNPYSTGGGYVEYEDDFDDQSRQEFPPLQNASGWDQATNDAAADAVVNEVTRNDVVFINLTQRLSFAEKDAARACRALDTWGNTADPASSLASEVDHRHRLSMALDWLSLHLTDAELKVGFQKKEKPELAIQAVRIKAVSHPSIEVATKLTEDADFLLSARLNERAVGFIRLGFAYEDVIDVLKATSGVGMVDERLQALDDSDTIRSLLVKLARQDSEAASISDLPGFDAEVAAEEREMEKIALEGIYDTAFEVLQAEQGKERYRISLDDGELHVLLSPSYPEQPPLFLFHDEASSPPLLREINIAIIERTMSRVGAPCVFEIVSFLGDSIAQIKETFTKELRLKDFNEKQREMRQLADGRIDDWTDDVHPTKRHPINTKEAQNEQTAQEFREARLSRIKEGDSNIRQIMAEKALRKREEERILEDIERVSRAAMSMSLNRGESVEEARLAASRAAQAYRVEHGIVSDEPSEEELLQERDPTPKIGTTESSTQGYRTTATTQAFMDRLRNMYTTAIERKRAPKVDDNQLHVDGAEDEAATYVPDPVAFPVGDLCDIMKDVSSIQKEQPWLCAEEARVPHVQLSGKDSQPVTDDADVSGKRDKISKQMSKDLQRRYASPNEPYRKILEQRQGLPAYQVRDTIVSTISANAVTVIAGETGSGKTTQAAQLILDDMIKRGIGSSANIIITQPRRISAISVAERISCERNEKVGQTCGYSIKLEKKVSSKTRLLLCTTGILLRRLQLDPDLASISHVFVDEVHERDINTDFLLIVMKELLRRRKGLKLILMSATLDASKFAEYFGDCAIVSIPGRTHPVEEYRLEDVLKLTGYEVKEESEYATKTGPGKPQARWSKGALKKLYYPRYPSHVIHSLSIVDESVMNYQLIACLLEYISLNAETGAILVFLPGMMEIKTTMEELYKKELFQDSNRFAIIPLHSSLSSSEQAAVFRVPPLGTRKIVLSTNLAETSITVEDVVFVVDTGRVKETQRDEVKETPALVDTWVSRAAAKQRRGRAGRVRPGVCYHLFSSHLYDEVLQPYQLPEMLRVGLEDLSLQIMTLDLGEPHEFLARSLDPPSALAAANALKLLEQLGAVECSWKQSTSDLGSDGDCGALQVSTDLTALGYHLASLPLEPRVGKMLIYGALFGCVGPALNFASAMTVSKPLFTTSFAGRDEADEARRALAVENSDLLTAATVFDHWLGLSGGPAHKYIRGNVLNRGTLIQMQELRQQYARYLADIGFLPTGFRLVQNQYQGANDNACNISLLKAILCAGLYPNVMVAPRSLTSGSSTQNAGEMAFQSHKRGEIYLHPSTILSSARHLNYRYGCFHEIVKTRKLYVRDCTLVSPIALILFGGAIDIYHGQGVITVDEWLRFRIPVRQAALLKHLRLHMERALLQRIVNPTEQSAESPIVKTLIDSVSLVLGNEKGICAPNDGREIVRPWNSSGDDSGRSVSRGGRGRGRGRGRGGRGGGGRD